MTPPVAADWLVGPSSEATVGGPRATKVVLRPELNLLRRILLNPQDVREASVSITLAPPARGMAEVLDEGRAAAGDVIALGVRGKLDAIPLGPDRKFALAVWRHQFHFNGGGTLAGAVITRESDGKTVSLPTFLTAPTAETELGTFRLSGYTKRGKFPVLEKEGRVVAGDKRGAWSVESSNGVGFASTETGLTFQTRGATNFDATFDWAPVLIFEPKQADSYRLGGKLTISSGQASDKNDPKPVRWMAMVIESHQKPAAGAKLQLHRLRREVEDEAVGTLAAGTDYDAAPLVSVALEALDKGQKQTVPVEGLAPLLGEWLAEPASAHGLLLTLQGPDARATAPKAMLASNGVKGTLRIVDHPAHALFGNVLRPRDGVFARLQDGKLHYGDQRLRLWGVVGYPDVTRLVNMGFNAQRVWAPYARYMYDAESAKRGELKPPVKGDGSEWDNADRHMADLRAAGCFIMLAGSQDTMPLQHVAVDGSFVSGGDDWEEWKAAVTAKEMQGGSTLARGPLFFDDRLAAIKKRHAKNLLTYVNPYTGKAVGQEEAIVIYEIFNENGGVKGILEGSYERWVPYFQTKFQKRWNAWLRERYADDAALRAAWGGLGDGESLADGTVRPGPKFADRNSFPKARGGDFVRFVIGMVDSFHQDFRAHCRSLAPKGVGVNVAPFSFDTQYRPSLAWNFLQGRGEVNSFGMYFWTLESTLAQPPSAYVMDSATVEGSASVLYETNVGRPNPCRAEYPLKLAAMASWQDWDGVFWHYWARGGGAVDEAYLALPLKHLTVSHYWDGVHHENDPVMCSAMAAAGRIFLGHRLAPAPTPAVVEVGQKGLYGYERHNGLGLAQQTFGPGARIRYTPDAPTDVTLDGQPLPPSQRVTGAVRSGEQITWDWPNGRLIVDAPHAKGYAGRIDGGYRFNDGIVLSDVGSKFVSFYLVSADGKPLVGPDPARRVYVTALGDARNTGFEFDWGVKGGPVEQAKAIRNRGRAPVVVERVPYTLWFPTKLSGRFVGYDFALRQVKNQSVAGNRIDHDGVELFMGVIEIDSRGAAAETPVIASSAAPTDEHVTGRPGAARPVAAGGEGAWNPLPAVRWDDDYHAAHRTLRDATYVFTTISREDLSDAADRVISIADAEIPTLWSAPADVEVEFRQGRMRTIQVTFKQPPPLAEVMEAYEKQFGAPAEKKLGTQYESSTAVWPATADRPSILITESQGILRIVYGRAK